MISQPIKLQQTTTLSPGLQPQTFKYVFRLSSTQANESNYDDQMCPEDSEAFYNVMIYQQLGAWKLVLIKRGPYQNCPGSWHQSH